MSWRVVFSPYPSPKDMPIDECIVEAATREDVESAADRMAWKMPLKLYARHPEDLRLQWFRYRLLDRWSMEESEYEVRYG